MNKKIGKLQQFIMDCRHDAQVYAQIADWYQMQEAVEGILQELQENTDAILEQGGEEAIAKVHAYLQDRADLFLPLSEELIEMVEKVKSEQRRPDSE